MKPGLTDSEVRTLFTMLWLSLFVSGANPIKGEIIGRMWDDERRSMVYCRGVKHVEMQPTTLLSAA